MSVLSVVVVYPYASAMSGLVGAGSVLGSPGARLDWVLADAARRAAPVRIGTYAVASDHCFYSHPNDRPELRAERAALLAEAVAILDGLRPESCQESVSPDLDRSIQCLQRADEIGVPAVTVVTVNAGSRVLVYWEWQFGYVLDLRSACSETDGLDIDLSLMYLESPYEARRAYGEALVELASRFAVAHVGSRHAPVRGA